MIPNNFKKILHVGKAKIGLTDEQYKDILRQCSDGKCESSADMLFTKDHFKRVMKIYEKLGFTPEKPQGTRPGMATPEQLAKIKAMWPFVSKANDQESAYREFLKKRFGVSDETFLTANKAGNVIDALKDMYLRRILTNCVDGEKENQLIKSFKDIHSTFKPSELAFLLTVAVSKDEALRKDLGDHARTMRSWQFEKLLRD